MGECEFINFCSYFQGNTVCTVGQARSNTRRVIPLVYSLGGPRACWLGASMGFALVPQRPAHLAPAMHREHQTMTKALQPPMLAMTPFVQKPVSMTTQPATHTPFRARHLVCLREYTVAQAAASISLPGTDKVRWPHRMQCTTRRSFFRLILSLFSKTLPLQFASRFHDGYWLLWYVWSVTIPGCHPVTVVAGLAGQHMAQQHVVAPAAAHCRATDSLLRNSLARTSPPLARP